MDIKKVKALASLAQKMNLTELEVAFGDSKICIKRNDGTAPAIPAPSLIQTSAPRTPEAHAGEVDFNNMHQVKSPMIGVFYSAASPDSAPFVSIGETVKKGQVLCIVEAMKVMNELVCEYDGEVIDICAKDGDVVEYGQTLFKIY